MFNRTILSLSLVLSLPIVAMNSGASSSSSSSSSSKKPDRSHEDFHGTSIKAMEEVYEDAPYKAKNLVAHLQDPSLFFRRNYRSLYLIGAPGVGKSTLAKAIAYKAGCDCEFFTCADFEREGKQRNETAAKLLAELERIVASNIKTVVIIDEINQLLENSGSAHHDTDMTSKAIWTFLDKQNNNPNFFLIGTMNEVEKIPKQIKSRAGARYIELFAPTDPVKKRNLFLKKLEDSVTQTHPECTDEAIDNILRDVAGWTGRDYEELSLEIVDIIIAQDKKNPKTVLLEHIKQGVASMKAAKRRFNIDRREELEEDRRHRESMEAQEKHHRESIMLQRRHYREMQKAEERRIAIQKRHHKEARKAEEKRQRETMEMQENHFAQQLFVQLEIAKYSSSMSREDHLKLQENLFSPEQKNRTYFNAMDSIFLDKAISLCLTIDEKIANVPAKIDSYIFSSAESYRNLLPGYVQRYAVLVRRLRDYRVFISSKPSYRQFAMAEDNARCIFDDLDSFNKDLSSKFGV